MFEKELEMLEIKNPPNIVGRYDGKPLVLCGSAHCLWSDMEPFYDKGWDFMTVNEAGLLFPFPISHWSSQHTECITPWVELRKSTRLLDGKTEDFLFHAHIEGPKVDIVWNSHKLTGGTSSWGAAVYAILMGYAPIVLVGVPLDDKGHFYDASYAPKDQSHRITIDHLAKVWQWAQDNIFNGKVQSMSGLTREICGAPS
jgi:hypothetical protein